MPEPAGLPEGVGVRAALGDTEPVALWQLLPVRVGVWLVLGDTVWLPVTEAEEDCVTTVPVARELPVTEAVTLLLAGGGGTGAASHCGCANGAAAAAAADCGAATGASAH